MRAVQYDRTGPAREVLRVVDLDDPVPGPDEVVVRISRSAVNPSDVKRRAGMSTGPLPEPQTPHQDGSGQVVAVGADVEGLEIGARVWVREAALGRPTGTAAEAVAVPRRRVHRLPEGVSDDVGAMLGIPFLTAHAALQTLGGPDLRGLAGATVAITGAGGSVGHAAVQFARHAGARTIGIASDDARRTLAREAGADAVLDRGAPDLVAMLREAAPDGVDLVVDVAFLANVARYADALAAGGTIVAMSSETGELPIRTLMQRNAIVRFLLVYSLRPDVTDAAVRGTDQLLTTGVVALPVHRFGLDEVAAAHEAVESGLVGRALIDPSVARA